MEFQPVQYYSSGYTVQTCGLSLSSLATFSSKCLLIFFILISDYLAVHVYQVVEIQFRFLIWSYKPQISASTPHHSHAALYFNSNIFFTNSDFFQLIDGIFWGHARKFWSPLPLIMKFTHLFANPDRHKQHFKHTSVLNAQRKQKVKRSFIVFPKINWFLKLYTEL